MTRSLDESRQGAFVGVPGGLSLKGGQGTWVARSFYVVTDNNFQFNATNFFDKYSRTTDKYQSAYLESNMTDGLSSRKNRQFETQYVGHVNCSNYNRT